MKKLWKPQLIVFVLIYTDLELVQYEQPFLGGTFQTTTAKQWQLFNVIVTRGSNNRWQRKERSKTLKKELGIRFL